MNRKVKWGLVTFIILIIGVSAVLLMRRTDPKPPINVYRGDTEPLTKKENPPPAEAGFKWVWHHDHWDKVPISEADQGNILETPMPAQKIGSVPVSVDRPDTSNENPEEHVLPLLTTTELDELYRQLSTEISSMNSDEALEKGLDLSQYSSKQRTYLLRIGINLSLLPIDLQDKITDFQWRKKGLETPPPGYTYIENADGSYRLHNKKDPIINVNIHRDEKGEKTAAFTFMGAEGQTLDEAMKIIMDKAKKDLETDSNKR